ncbi:hypothetical protein M431DRAFT_205376 [Trichoderma harzianum CBS 226.95]|uniref:Uncharacterized protein n=1 Tax=Trichoderma harzianum CBS 226.95 TaxID=983964 RepID=A0A2T4AVT7_TRIHA|nr:hypothetical protein M431DRAFT_205376 [Trichoderma harzianum CBS 226.95]PTB61182.1 hypothetical protein M431DRAFT_205376 [Trichoderma harzianum CBS 226.95]
MEQWSTTQRRRQADERRKETRGGGVWQRGGASWSGCICASVPCFFRHPRQNLVSQLQSTPLSRWLTLFSGFPFQGWLLLFFLSFFFPALFFFLYHLILRCFLVSLSPRGC